jgi:ribulose bisphosphate carboxylase small subunit
VIREPGVSMPDTSPHSTSYPRAVKQLDELERLARVVRVEAAYLRSLSRDTRKQRRTALPVVARPDGARMLNPASGPRSRPLG